MNFADIFHWAQNSGTLAAAEQQAAAMTAKAIQSAMNKAIGHAPDMQAQIQQGATMMLQAAVAGLAMKAKA